MRYFERAVKRRRRGRIIRVKVAAPTPPQLMQFLLSTIERQRLLLPIPFELAKVPAFFLQFLPDLLLTPDQVELLRFDNVVSDAARAGGLTLEGLGITPDSLEAIAPQYLWRFRPAGQFQRTDA